MPFDTYISGYPSDSFCTGFLFYRIVVNYIHLDVLDITMDLKVFKKSLKGIIISSIVSHLSLNSQSLEILENLGELTSIEFPTKNFISTGTSFRTLYAKSR